MYDTSPKSDFQKYPNANIREIPNGIFPGKSKLVYDVLYSMTRGAIRPSRTVRISKPQLMAKAGIGSKVTLDKVIEHFRSIRLVNVEERPGEHLGNVYEVLIFGEHESHTTQTSGTTESSPTQNLVVLHSAESSQSSTSATSINTGIPEAPKTFFKDFLNHDDEKPLRDALERFAKTAQETTGREVTKADCVGLAQAINQMIDEAVAGAARTDVTCFGKFAAENLKRRLSRKPREAGNRVEFFDPGRHDQVLDESAVEIIELTPDPLGERRELHLESLRGMVENYGIEHIEIYRSGYTDEDWEWLMENLRLDEQ